MARWILKSMLQRGISLLPRSYWWNSLLQKHVTRGYYPNDTVFRAKLEWCRRHLDSMARHGSGRGEGFTALELGTGTWPVVPIGLYLCGASRVYTYDITPLLNRELVAATMELFCRAGEDGSLGALLPGLRGERLEVLKGLCQEAKRGDPHGVLKQMDIHWRVAGACSTGLDSGEVDLVFSTVVLEHIPPAIISALFREFHRVMAAGAVMSHYIGLADQYAGRDSSITPFNFLRYTSAQWKWLNNPIIPLTRLRLPDYRKLHRESGFEVVEEQSDRGREEDLKRVPLAEEFRGMDLQDLLVLFSWLVSVKAQVTH